MTHKLIYLHLLAHSTWFDHSSLTLYFQNSLR